MGNILGDYIHRKRQELGLSLRKFGKLCRLSHTYIDSIEKGIDFRTGKPVGLTNDTLLKLAEGLHVHVDILFLLSLENISDHFSFYYDSAQRQQIERVCWPIIRDRTQPIENRFSAAIDLFRSFYSASIEFVAFDINHVDFKTYVAMLLNQSSWINLFGINLYQKLVDQYGIKGGIQDGEIHFIPIVQEETEHQKKKRTL